MRSRASWQTWPLEKLQPSLRDLPVVLPVVSRRHDIAEATLVAVAAVIHVDVARRAGTDEDVDRNLALGERVSTLLPVEDDGGPVTRFRARWHHAAGTVLCGFSRPHDARRHFEIARKLRPDDSGILWPPPGDPWWLYQQGQWHAIAAILETLQQEVPR